MLVFPAENVTCDLDERWENFFFSFFFASVNVPVVSVKRGVSRGSNPAWAWSRSLDVSFSVEMSFFHFRVVPC